MTKAITMAVVFSILTTTTAHAAFLVTADCAPEGGHEVHVSGNMGKGNNKAEWSKTPGGNLDVKLTDGGEIEVGKLRMKIVEEKGGQLSAVWTGKSESHGGALNIYTFVIDFLAGTAVYTQVQGIQQLGEPKPGAFRNVKAKAESFNCKVIMGE